MLYAVCWEQKNTLCKEMDEYFDSHRGPMAVKIDGVRDGEINCFD